MILKSLVPNTCFYKLLFYLDTVSHINRLLELASGYGDLLKTISNGLILQMSMNRNLSESNQQLGQSTKEIVSSANQNQKIPDITTFTNQAENCHNPNTDADEEQKALSLKSYENSHDIQSSFSLSPSKNTDFRGKLKVVTGNSFEYLETSNENLVEGCMSNESEKQFKVTYNSDFKRSEEDKEVQVNSKQVMNDQDSPAIQLDTNVLK